MKRILLFIIFGLLSISVSASSIGRFKKVRENFKVNRHEDLIIYIEIDAGEISVSKNTRHGEISLSGRINEKYDELDYDYDKRHNEFSLTLDRKKWFKSVTDDNSSNLEIELPDDVIIEFNSKVKAGAAEFSLGGLSLKELDLRNFAGEVHVEFRQPNKIEMNSLHINVKIGETRIKRLGNARFNSGNINSGIGELFVDLTGQGTESMEVDIDLDIGSTTILLPRESGIKLKNSTMGFLTDTTLDSEFEKRGRYYYSNNYNSASKTLYANIHSGIGELRIDLR